MLISGALEKAKLYIETHSKDSDLRERGKFERGPCVTISRETGAGADIISHKLVEIFTKYKKPHLPDWTIFEKNLIQKVIEDHHLPQTLTEVFDEKKYSSILSFASEILVGQPSVQTLVYKTTKTILSLAEIGNVIIIGRAGNVVTSNLANAFHVRLVSTLEDRIKHVSEVYGYDAKQAAEFLKKDDLARRNYISTYFHKQIDDPQLYHLTINTHRVKHDQAAEIIADAMMTKFPKCFNLCIE